MEQILRVIPEKGDDSLVLFDKNGPMLRSSVILLFLSFVCLSSGAEAPQRKFAKAFQSSRLWFPSKETPLTADGSGRYPFIVDMLFKNVLSWVPTGAPQPLGAGCEADLWAERMKDPRLSGKGLLQGGLVEKYFRDCRDELTTGSTGAVMNSTRMMSMKYNPQEHPFLQRTVLQLPGNVRLKALLGLKGDMKKRPFVVMRLGIFSNIEDFKPERAWLMMLFEQSPFNVLVVENMTSSDFVANNSHFSFGGYDEGLQNIHIARLLKDPNEPLSKIVGSLHFFGVSLGGHGLLYASLLNKYNSPKGEPLIRSFSMMCPVVNLQETMQSLTDGGFFSKLVDVWSRQRLLGLTIKLDGLTNYDNFSFLKTAVAEVTRSYRGGLSYTRSIRLPPGVKDSPDFWGLNNFWKDYKDVTQPVLIYATRKDPAVPFEINSGKLQDKSMKVQSRNIRVIDLPEGYHCTLPIPYDWRALSTMLQSYILANSPEFRLQERSLAIELDEEWSAWISPETQVRLEVAEPGQKARFVRVEVTAERDGDEKKLSLSLPLSDFDFQLRDEELTDSETEMILRWVNQNLKVELRKGPKAPLVRVSWMVAP